MKKVFYLLIAISLAFILPSKVLALSGDLSIECDSTTKKVGESISCILYGHSDDEVSAVETTLKYDDGLTLSNPVVPSIWQGDYENKSLLLYTDTNKSLKFELLRFNITSNSEGTYNFTFKDTYFTDKLFSRVHVSNPNYRLKFISEEEAKEEEEKTIAVVINPDTSSETTTTTENKTTETEENPNSGTFIPYILIITLFASGVVIRFKTKKKIFKL